MQTLLVIEKIFSYASKCNITPRREFGAVFNGTFQKTWKKIYP